MLDESEWEQFEPFLTPAIKEHRERHGSSISDARDAVAIRALDAYFELTGFRETDFDALWHHRISICGEPCPNCAKPLRTPQARLCPACGWQQDCDDIDQKCSMNRASKWKQCGQIRLWRYLENQRNFPGWHLNADEAGRRSLLELLDSFEVDASGTRILSLASPTQAQLDVPNNRGGSAKWVAAEKLRVTIAREANHWSFPPELNPASLSIGLNWLAPLREGIAGIGESRGDYAIGENEAIWLWW